MIDDGFKSEFGQKRNLSGFVMIDAIIQDFDVALNGHVRKRVRMITSLMLLGAGEWYSLFLQAAVSHGLKRFA